MHVDGYVVPFTQASMVRIATAVVFGEVVVHGPDGVLRGVEGRVEGGEEDNEEDDDPAGNDETVSNANTVSTSAAWVCSIGLTSHPRIKTCSEDWQASTRGEGRVFELHPQESSNAWAEKNDDGEEDEAAVMEFEGKEEGEKAASTCALACRQVLLKWLRFMSLNAGDSSVRKQ